LIHFKELLLFKLLVLKELFALLKNVLSHLHCLFEVLITILQNLLKSLLIHAYHFLLLFKHLRGHLRLLDVGPV